MAMILHVVNGCRYWRLPLLGEINRRGGAYCLLRPVLRYGLISRGFTNLNLKAVSAGSSTSRFPVKAAPPVPAPAPIRPPINAPFPPPANPPISAPPPAPPPTSAPVRLPFPFFESSGVDARISYRWPLTSMVRNASPNSDAPLKRPAALALVTVPLACAPLGMTSCPSTTTGSTTVAEKDCPSLAVLELSDWSSTTSIAVPWGTIIGWGAGACAGAFIG